MTISEVVESAVSQASKNDNDQPQLADMLPRFEAAAGIADVVVVGCGPAGLALASELASRGVFVALIGDSRCQ